MLHLLIFLGLVILAVMNAYGMSFLWEWYIAGWMGLWPVSPSMFLVLGLIHVFGFRGLKKTTDSVEDIAAQQVALTIVFWIVIGIAYLLK